MSQKKFYGICFFMGNRTCTSGDPHPITGRMNRAADVEVFLTREDLARWLSEEESGKTRIKTSKRGARRVCLGMSVADFEQYLENQEYSRYQ